MLVTFRTDAYENIIYFSNVAQRLLAYMGHSGTIPGAIKSEDLSEALQKLQFHLSQEHNNAKKEDDEDEISLAKRAVPLIHLLQAAIKKNKDVLWD